MNKTILVTGSTGFVGKQVLRALDMEGIRLVLPIRPGSEPKLPALTVEHRLVFSPDIFAESDIWWAETCTQVDTIIHIAWYVEPGKYLSSPKNLDCLIGSIQMVQGAIKSGVKRIIGTGTCFEYDLSSGVLSTKTPISPITLYASAKASLYFNLLSWLPSEQVSFAWCRLFYLYGEGEDENRLVPYIRKQIEHGEEVLLTSGTQIRDYLDVEEAGKQIAQVSLSDQTGAVNICSGIPITVRQLTEKIADEYGRRDLLKFGTRKDNLLDPPCVVGIPG